MCQFSSFVNETDLSGLASLVKTEMEGLSNIQLDSEGHLPPK